MTARRPLAATLPLALTAMIPQVCHAQTADPRADQWVPLWTASPQRVWDDENSFFETGLPAQIEGVAVDQPLTLALPSDRVRIEFSNRYGASPLELADGTVRCLDAGEGKTIAPLTFAQSARVSAPAGATALSDPVAMNGCRRIAVRIRFAGENGGDFHWDARETSRFVTADGAEGTMTARLALSAVYGDVDAREVVVALGDSITDGNGAQVDAMARWPDYLAQDLAPQNIVVVNAGISGNRLLSPGMGEPALERIASEVFALPRADTVVVLIGTNDIAWPGTPFRPDEPMVTLEALQDGVRSLIAQAELHGTRMILSTIAPFGDALPGTPMEGNYWTPEKDALRRAFNDWLRAHQGSATLFDLDRLLAHPADPVRLLPAYDSGDRLHPGAQGNRAIADALVTLIQSGDRH
ncbi:hypothetical protein K3175_05760 [Qipengyuania sp. GH1]|uniref:GDSL-type esterase/lipase family protein n=1 Tax=Qipengyuania aestuarii TaxID=2867241 RepID=UPI001C87EC30|nr:GDSL-type esterase/lipase family protein [Qipengyuania aestuarii]MBX7535159.1 hypothetical protein [Qipengyuania aestuarii]